MSRLRAGIRAAALAAGLLVLGAHAAHADAPRALLEQADRLYTRGRFEEALAVYREGILRYPSVPEFHHGAGNALYRLHRFPDAAREYDQAAAAAPGPVRAASRYNQGDAQVRQNQLAEALENYRESLRQHPEDRDAKFNYELIKARLHEQQQQNQGGGKSQSKQPQGGGNRPKPQPGQSAQESPGTGPRAGRADPQGPGVVRAAAPGRPTQGPRERA